MQKTELSLECSTHLNPKVLRIFDTSSYCESDNITNFLVEILPVNKDKWVVFHVDKKFSLVLNSSNLRYNIVSDINNVPDLQDGIYEIKLSIKPNSSTLKHFYHLRTTLLVRKLMLERTKLLAEECKISREEFKMNRDKLREIEEFIDSAKYMVEENGDRKKGKELYKWAEKLIEQYSNECRC